MSRVDLSTWSPEEIDSFEQLFTALKAAHGDSPLALTPDQRDIATQLGLMPPLTALVEANVDGKMYRGLFAIGDDDVYRGALHPKQD